MPEAVERCGAAAGDKRLATRFPGRLSAAGALTLASVAVPFGAHAQAPVGPALDLPGIGAPSVTGPGVSLALPVVITPSLQVGEQFTDNTNSTPTQRLSDLITTVTPGLFITDQSPRLQGVFNYSPEGIKHVAVTSQDQIIQNLLANGTLTAVPNLLLFDVQASASEASRVGDRGFGNNTQIPTSAATQTFIYSGSPYLQYHFGDKGDGELRYRFSETAFSGNTGAIASTDPNQSVAAISNSIVNEFSGKFTTGEAFGRLQLSSILDYTHNASDAATSSKSTTASVTSSYLISQDFTGLLTVGYDRLVYPSQSTGFNGNFTGPDYSGGFRYQPREDRIVTLTYGRSQGQSTFNGNATYAVTPLTTMSAAYTQQTTTTQQQLLQNLGQATQITPGNTISQATGLPLSIVNPNLALQNAVLRIQTLTAGATIIGNERNRYTFQINRMVENALSGGGLSQTSTGLQASWNRDMRENLQGTLSAAYTTTSSAAIAGSTSTSSDTLTVSALLNYTISPTLTATAGYQFTRQDGVNNAIFGGVTGVGSTSGSVIVDLVTLTFIKSF